MKRLLVAVFAVLMFAACGSSTPPGPAVVDKTPPEILMLTVDPPRAGAGDELTIRFDVSEATRTLEVQVAGHPASCSGNLAFRCTFKVYGDEGDGEQPIHVRAVDLAGNVGEADGFFTVDTTAPKVSFTRVPGTLTNQANGSIEFSADEPATFTCEVDQAGGQPCTSPLSYSGLAEGQHQIKVSATDDVGNQGSASASFWVDLTLPDTIIDPQPPAVTSLTALQIAFRASEESTFECRLDQGDFAACTSPASVSLTSEGPHRFEVRATDVAGNVESEPAFAEFVHDVTPPTTTIDAIPDDGKPDREIRFSASEAGCLFHCAVGSQAPAPCTSPWTVHALVEGTHLVIVQATDAAGNLEARPASASVVVDLTGPVVTFASTPPALSLVGTATFEMSASEAGSTFECSLDLLGYKACTSPATFTVATGDHSLLVRGTDKYGNPGNPVSFGWKVDLNAPVVTIDSQPATFTKDRGASVGFSGNKAGMSFTCALDGAAPPAACTSPVTYSGLADGSHSVAIVGTDGGGNISAPATASWTVDNAAPATSISSIPDTGKPDRSITFSASETGCTFECAVDAAAFAPCTSPAALSGLADGSRTFKVRATDQAGNRESPEASATFVVDTKGPAATILTGPTGTVFVAGATFTFESDEAASTFECRLDADAFAACTTPKDLSVATDGPHAFEVRATDRYGNPGAAAAKTWTVDAFPPTVTLTAKPAQPTRQTDASFSFTSNKANATFTCAIDGGAALSCTSPKSYSSLADGPHHFEVVAIDAASRPSAPAKADWTVDTLAPTATLGQAPPALSNQTTVHFTFGASETGSTFECSLDGGAYAPCGTPDDFSIGEGVHTFAVRAVDPAGNTGAASSYTFEIDLTPPSAPAIDQPDPSLTTNTTPTFSWGAAATAVSYSFELSSTEDFGQVAQSKSATTLLYYAATALPSDRYYFRANARDAAGNDSAWSKTGILEVRTWGFFNPRPQGATMLRVSCLDSQTCWFVGEAGLATRTLDGGATFRQASTGVAGSLTGLHVFDAATAVACGFGGAVLRTTDGGITWFSIPSGVTADLYTVRFSGPVGYAAGDGGTVIRSADGGLTWKKLATPTTASLRDLAILDSNATTVVAVGGTGVSIRTQDGGNAWAPGTTGTTALLRSVSFVDALDGFAVGAYASAGKNMRKTVDGGKTWSEVATGITKDLYGVHFVDALKGWTMGDSDNSIASLRYTTDGGTTWLGDGQYPLTVRPPLRAMALDPATGAGMAVGDGGNVLKTADTWATYFAVPGVTGTLSTKTDDQEIRVVRFVSPTVGYLFGNSGFAMKTTDGGETLTALSPSVIGVRDLHAASFLDASNGFVGGDTTSSFIARTTDGSTFVRQTTPSINVRGLHYVSPTYCIFVGTSGKVVEWKSGAFGLVTIPVATSLRAVRMVDESRGFIVGDGGEILVSSGGAWVSEKIPGVTNNLWGVWAVDATTAFAVGDGGRLLKRTSAGWASPPSGTTATLKDIAFADPLNGWIVGDGTILVTSDGGTTWKKQVSPTGSTLQSVSAVSADVVFAVGSARAAIRTTLGGR
ncbi:MAG TPA: YCF48-related protein [Myxococcales bacterium]